MNGKISFHQLAEQMSATNGVPVSQAENFIKALFESAASALEKGESVDIAGLGTFHPGDDSENPVILIPDNEFARAVNAPFDMFEPQELAAPEEELNAVNNVEYGIQQDSSTQPITPPVVVSSTEATEGVEEVAAETSVESTATPVTIVPPVYVAEEAIIASDATASPSKDNVAKAEAAVEEVESEQVTAISGDSTTQTQMPEPVKPAAPISEPPAVAPAPLTPPVVEPAKRRPLPPFPEEEVEANSVQTYSSATSDNDNPVTVDREYDRHYDDNVKSKGSRFGIGFFIGMLCGIALGALAMFLIFLISTKMYSSETLIDSQADLETTQEALMSIGSSEE